MPGFPLDPSSRLVAEPVVGDNALALSVGELSMKLKRMVEGEFGYVRLRGEISGYKRVASGHAYLCLKDDQAAIDGVIWKQQAGTLAFRPEDGVEVIDARRFARDLLERDAITRLNHHAGAFAGPTHHERLTDAHRGTGDHDDGSLAAQLIRRAGSRSSAA